MWNWFAKWWKNPRRPAMITLRDSREGGEIRSLTATLNRDGSLAIDGMDYGDTVERFFGEREYEWHWRVGPEGVTRLCAALGVEDDLLTALGSRFSGEGAADLQSFLDQHDIAYEAWSRTGD